MPKRGLTSSGLIDKVKFGPGGVNITIDTPTAINNVPTYSSLYSSPQDIYAKNLTINNQLLPVAKSNPSGQYGCFRVFCSGTLTLNSGGSIIADGFIPNSFVVPTQTGGAGFDQFNANDGNLSFGTLGGSGYGGNGNPTGNGLAGKPDSTKPEDTYIVMGGAGLVGASLGGNTGGAGGLSAFDTRKNSMFQPSVYNDMIVWGNQNGSFATLFPRHITGGAGGGGAGGSTAGSGGGTGGGGVVYICADRVVFNGGGITAECQGGGPGGLGGGGVIVIVASSIEFTGSSYEALSVQGGSPGNILIFSNDLVGSFSGSMSKNDYLGAVANYQN